MMDVYRQGTGCQQPCTGDFRLCNLSRNNLTGELRPTGPTISMQSCHGLSKGFTLATGPCHRHTEGCKGQALGVNCHHSFTSGRLTMVMPASFTSAKVSSTSSVLWNASEL